MTDIQRKYLIDVEDAILHIESFTISVSSLKDYEENLLVRRGVERELEIIGEALGQLLKTENPPDISNARRIVDLRNRIIHGYDSVDNAIIWGILERHLLELKAQVGALLHG